MFVILHPARRRFDPVSTFFNCDAKRTATKQCFSSSIAAAETANKNVHDQQQIPPRLTAQQSKDIIRSMKKHGRIPATIDRVVSDLDNFYRKEIYSSFGEVAKNDVDSAIAALRGLREQIIANDRFSPLNENASDAHIWDSILLSDKEVNTGSWHNSPFLFSECYFYRKMWEPFEISPKLARVDPYRLQKEESFEETINHVVGIGGALLAMIQRPLDFETAQQSLLQLLQLSLWANRCDLGLHLPHRLPETIHLELDGLRPKILVDNLEAGVDCLLNLPLVKGKRRVDIVLDNSGLEFFIDLCFADFMLSHALADRIVLHGKQFPWFISDVTSEDLKCLLKRLKTDNRNESLRNLGNRWTSHFQRGLLEYTSHPFWTFPHAHNKMPIEAPELYLQLKDASFVLFKGDLNYRKLVEDRRWPFDTPFKNVLLGFEPTSFLSLRTVKQETIAGLTPSAISLVEDRFGPANFSWMQTGEYGLVQLFLSRSDK